MQSLEKLMDLSASYATYVVLGSAALIVGLMVANLGGFFAEDLFKTIAGLLVYPGRCLVMGGLLACGLAGDGVPGGVRVASVVMATVLFFRFFALVPFLSV
ncbi:MAG: hypothetical protein ACI9WU_000261 [Myxococcota bacterium]|jgi:hypothetical protein